MAKDVLDVAVVGAGVSGVYCAWRLLSTGAAGRVGVFEGSERIGGRLLSAMPPGMPTLRAELGGMRILKGVQTRITNLVAVLGIETYPFPVTDPDDLVYVRGVHLRESDFADRTWDIPYRLGAHEKGKTAAELVIDAIEQVVPGILAMDATRRREVVKDATFEGRPLYQQGFWQVLYRVMSNEAYELAVTAGGYQTTLSSWNAADAIPSYLTDFSGDAQYHGFVRGFETVPHRIAAEVVDAGGTIEHSRWLRSVDRADDGTMALRFGDGETVRAKAVVLAMPRRSLELLEPTGAVFGQPRVRALMQSVTPRPLLKLFTAYRNPWWTSSGVESGRSVTDLPARQVYYWPNIDGTPRRRGNSLLMASYDDGRNVGFWEGFRHRRRPGEGDPDPAQVGLDDFAGVRMPQPAEAEAWDAHPAPRAMVEEVQRQLAELHGLKYVPVPYTAAFKDWGVDPYGGGWNTWNVGVRSWEVEAAMLQPVTGIPVYVCGEAYSREQGWVEGALDTADQVLARYFKVAGLV